MSDEPSAEGSEDAVGLPAGYGAEMLEYVRGLPGGKELLEASERHGGCVELVGGAVRDTLLGGTPRELDVIVRDRVEELARELAEKLQGELTLHERFGTAAVCSDIANVDLATLRAESYSSPGALPDVAPGTPEQDLERRDFTVNAIALGLTGECVGRVRSVEGASRIA
jgi:tRNA nucleotidyltransferase (CCA-adding enzyme)